MSVVVSALLVRPNGEILVHLRDDDPRIVFPNVWSLIGGHAEEGETPEQTLVREVEEEIGFRVENPVHLAVFCDGAATRHLFVVPIDVPIDALTLTEGQAIRYIAPQQALTELDLAVTGRRYIEAYLRHLEFMEYLEKTSMKGETEKKAFLLAEEDRG
ncbi:MAG: NUDIX domain-containing protein [candidate division Zixibacteria bacterium]|nr:NUDIX domain-containing protein [candidate division Zixibacteria bacterium]